MPDENAAFVRVKEDVANIDREVLAFTSKASGGRIRSTGSGNGGGANTYRNRSTTSAAKGLGKGIACLNCAKEGHRAADYRAPPVEPNDRSCFKCWGG